MPEVTRAHQPWEASIVALYRFVALDMYILLAYYVALVLYPSVALPSVAPYPHPSAC